MENDFKERVIDLLIELMNKEGDAHSDTLDGEHLRNAQALSRAIKLVKEVKTTKDATKQIRLNN